MTRERIVALDVLRGVAALGILIMNVQSFAMPEAAYFNPSAYGELEGLDGSVWLLSHLVADRKFMTIFSLLFGAGILLFARGAESRGRSAGPLHARRMGWLLLFGAAHAYLLWYGDILFTYAVCGLLVFPLRRMRPGRRLALGLAVFAVASILNGADSHAWPSVPLADRAERVAETWAPPAEWIEEEIDAYRGTWLDQMSARVPTAWAIQTDYLVRCEFWRIAGLMLIGMSLFQWGILSAARSRRFYAGLAAAGLLLGLPATTLGVLANRAHGWDPAYSMFAGWQWNYWASLPLALSWIALVMLVVKSPAARVLHPFAAVGRVAFSTYLLETVLMSLVFYGHGLGWFGSVERGGQALVVLAAWVILVPVAVAWIHAFRMGPLEWAWRALTYGEAPAFRRTRGNAGTLLEEPTPV